MLAAVAVWIQADLARRLLHWLVQSKTHWSNLQFWTVFFRSREMYIMLGDDGIWSSLTLSGGVWAMFWLWHQFLYQPPWVKKPRPPMIIAKSHPLRHLRLLPLNKYGHFQTLHCLLKIKFLILYTVVPGFSVLGFRALPWFRALITGNQIWVYVIDLPGFSALPGFRAPFCGDGQSTLNPGTTVPVLWSFWGACMRGDLITESWH